MASKSTLLGAAGAHHVMSELLRRGYIAALAPEGAPTIDILVTDLEGGRLCSIQVKTRRDIGADGGWHMKAKHENMDSERLFYCFVDFGKSPEAIPTVHVLPSIQVATVLSKAHQQWLLNPSKRGGAHKDGPMRRFKPDYSDTFGHHTNPYPKGWLDPYLNAWQLLRLEQSDADEETETY